MEDVQPEAPESKMARGIAPLKQQYIKAKVSKATEKVLAAVPEVLQLGEDGTQAGKIAPKKKSRRAFKKVEHHRHSPCVCHIIQSSSQLRLCVFMHWFILATSGM